MRLPAFRFIYNGADAVQNHSILQQSRDGVQTPDSICHLYPSGISLKGHTRGFPLMLFGTGGRAFLDIYD